MVSIPGSIFADFEVHESIGVTTNMVDPALLASSTALLTLVTAMPLTPGTIQTIQTSNVPIVDLYQAIPSVSGSAGSVPISCMAEPQVCIGSASNGTNCFAVYSHAHMMQAPAMQAPAMKFSAMPSMVSPSVMTARPNQLGFVSAPLNVQGTQFQGSYICIYA